LFASTWGTKKTSRANGTFHPRGDAALLSKRHRVGLRCNHVITEVTFFRPRPEAHWTHQYLVVWKTAVCIFMLFDSEYMAHVTIIQPLS
jgi:hypothetical protein